MKEKILAFLRAVAAELTKDGPVANTLRGKIYNNYILMRRNDKDRTVEYKTDYLRLNLVSP